MKKPYLKTTKTINSMFLRFAVLTALIVFTSSCKKDDVEPEVVRDTFKTSYTIAEDGFYPEGVDYDETNERFVIGSMYQGAVYKMNTNGELLSIISDDKLVSVAGVYTDEARNRLIVANGDNGVSKKSASGGASAGSIATIFVYNLTSGALIQEVNLKDLTPNAGAFPNDIAVDGNGNIYVTDSFSPVIYLIDGSYKASILTSNDLFKPAPNSFGLNGIVYHSDGYLIVCKTDDGKLYKVPVSTPDKVTEITDISISAPDGLEWNKNQELVVVENGLGKGVVYTFSSTNNWGSATKMTEVTIGSDEFPTTATLTPNGKVYVINSQLGKLFGGDNTQSTFTLRGI